MSSGKRAPLEPRSVFDLPVLISSLAEVGKNAEHARTIQKHALKSGTPAGVSWGDVCKGQDLPKAVVNMLDKDFVRCTSKIVERRESKDGTIKLIIQLQDKMEVETVIIPMSPGYSTVCLSSQVGCAMGCTFCATGMLGLKGNLTAGEICEQLVHAKDVAGPSNTIRNVVFMGMGEPLHNYDNVLTAAQTFVDQKTFSLPSSGVTISTVGVVHGIKKLARDAPWVRLAFSLHSPEQETRKVIIPSANKFPLEDIIDAIDYYTEKSKAKVMIEFTVLKGTNDDEETAHKMGKLLTGKHVQVNLIPYNPTSVKEEYQIPSEEAVETMWQILVKSYNLKCTIRQQHGVDIGGACGQLALTRDGGIVLPENTYKPPVRSYPNAPRDSKKHSPRNSTSRQSYMPLALCLLAFVLSFYVQYFYLS
eukprot:TRINITY_DN3280_c0_g1_i1.p1 TRINITY_DN3280_c0_g1~~TRINITY_DN3280_c0_g1_i1.p1  ORF type:complete len:419 (+),score=148.23 TRINITY_DN3280_c0_g1_i1:53-1309(+)